MFVDVCATKEPAGTDSDTPSLLQHTLVSQMAGCGMLLANPTLLDHLTSQ